MKPVLFSLGPFSVYSFGAVIALGVLVSLFFMVHRARHDGFPKPDHVYDGVFTVLLSGFLGGRLLYGLQNLESYRSEPLKILAFWEGGLVFYGGVLGSLLGLWIFSSVKRLPYWQVLDFLIPYVALTHAFGRIGCFLNGCCYGKVCPFPWGVPLPGHAEALHPTQLYEALFLIGLFFVLSALYKRRRFDGEVFASYLMLYAAGRFAVEFFRGDNPIYYFWTRNQWLSLVAAAAGGLLYFSRIRAGHASKNLR